MGFYTDHRPKPYSLADGHGIHAVGCCCCRRRRSFRTILVAVALVGVGSSVFHPESSRVARMASGGQHGLAQSLFQVGGNAGRRSVRCWRRSSCCPDGQRSIAWFALAALLAIVVLIAHREPGTSASERVRKIGSRWPQ